MPFRALFCLAALCVFAAFAKKRTLPVPARARGLAALFSPLRTRMRAKNAGRCDGGGGGGGESSFPFPALRARVRIHSRFSLR